MRAVQLWPRPPTCPSLPLLGCERASPYPSPSRTATQPVCPQPTGTGRFCTWHLHVTTTLQTAACCNGEVTRLEGSELVPFEHCVCLHVFSFYFHHFALLLQILGNRRLKMPGPFPTVTCMYVMEARCKFTRSDLWTYQSPTKLHLDMFLLCWGAQQQRRQTLIYRERWHNCYLSQSSRVIF